MNTKNILLVDDEVLVLEELAETFEFEGFDVTTALSGEDALKLDNIHDIDVVVSDLRMPGFNGLDLCKILSLRPHFHAKMILLSGHGSQDTRDEAYRLGFFACLSKPVDIGELVSVVDKALQ